MVSALSVLYKIIKKIIIIPNKLLMHLTMVSNICIANLKPSCGQFVGVGMGAD